MACKWQLVPFGLVSLYFVNFAASGDLGFTDHVGCKGFGVFS